jgi:hypothetical protein
MREAGSSETLQSPRLHDATSQKTVTDMRTLKLNYCVTHYTGAFNQNILHLRNCTTDRPLKKESIIVSTLPDSR